MNSDFRRQVAVELARAGKTQWQLARALGVSPSTLSGWLCGAHPAPSDLVQRIERALEIEGRLSAA